MNSTFAWRDSARPRALFGALLVTLASFVASSAASAADLASSTCTVAANGALACGKTSASVSTTSDTARLIVLRLSPNATGSLTLPTGQQYELGTGGFPVGVKFKVAGVPTGEAGAGVLSASTLAQIKSDAGLGTLTVADGHLTASSSRLSQYVADQASRGQVWLALRLQTYPTTSLAACATACSLSSDLRLFSYSRLGLQGARTQPSIPLPGGGSLAVDAETGNGVLSLFDPDALTANSCFDYTPTLNRLSAEPSGDAGAGFVTPLMAVRRTGTSFAGPSGWVVPTDSDAATYARRLTGFTLTATGDGGLDASDGDRRWSFVAGASSPSSCRDLTSGGTVALGASPDGSISDSKGFEVTLTHDASNRLTRAATGDSAVDLTYAEGRLDQVAFNEDSDALTVTWSSVGTRLLPTVLTYSTGATLTIGYGTPASGGGAPVSSAVYRDSTGAAKTALTRAGTEVTIDGTSQGTTLDRIGRVIGPDGDPPKLAGAPSSEARTLLTTGSGAGMTAVTDAVVQDPKSGIASIKVLADYQEVLSVPVGCGGPFGCPTDVDLSQDPRAIDPAVLTASDLQLVVTDAAGNETSFTLSRRSVESQPLPTLDDVAISTPLNGAAGNALVSWTLSGDDQVTAPVTMTAQWRKSQSDPWTSADVEDLTYFTIPGAASGDTFDVRLMVSRALDAASASTDQTLTIAAPDRKARIAPTDVPEELQGIGDQDVTVHVMQAVNIGEPRPLANTRVVYKAFGRKVDSSGVERTVVNEGYVTTDENGDAQIENVFENCVQLFISDEEFVVPAGTGARSYEAQLTDIGGFWESPNDDLAGEEIYATRSGNSLTDYYNKLPAREASWCFSNWDICQGIYWTTFYAGSVPYPYNDTSSGGSGRWQNTVAGRAYKLEDDDMRSNSLKHAVWTAAATRVISEMDRDDARWTGKKVVDHRKKALEMTFRHELPFKEIDKRYDREKAIREKRRALMDRWNDKKGYSIAAGLGSKAFSVTCRTVVQRSYNSKHSKFKADSYRWAPGDHPRGNGLVHIDDNEQGRTRRSGYGPKEACDPMEQAYYRWRRARPQPQTPPTNNYSAYRYVKPKDGPVRICTPIEHPEECNAIFANGDGCQVCLIS